MNERIKSVRVMHGLNQTDFAKRLSISRSAVCKIESGENSPSDQTINLICKEFDINEEWLRTGNGKPYVERTKKEQIAKMLDNVLKGSDTNFKFRLISALAELDDTDWDSLEKIIRLLSNNNSDVFSYDEIPTAAEIEANYSPIAAKDLKGKNIG